MLDYRKTPWPWFGGKTDASPHVWAALGDVPHYVEPFAGGLAVLLRRPHPCNRTYYSETVNDADGMLINAWRSIQWHPDATAEAASWPVAEADLMARHLALVKWGQEHHLERLMADPKWCDPVMGGWWIWGCCSWIGSGWCDGRGPWIVGADGRITKQERGPGREPGVSRQRPHLGDDGQGANRPQLREPGVSRQRPHLVNNGQGANYAGTREPGVAPGTPDRPWEPGDFHAMTMPELRAWFAFLSARLRHVRILNGDWSRAVTTGAAHTLPARQGHGPAGVFLDPPYSHEERDDGLYAVDAPHLAADVRAWCLKHGDNPRFRIVLAGFEGEGHEELEQRGWRVQEWFATGFLKGGMGQLAKRGEDEGPMHQQGRERLWFSPHCVAPEAADAGLFGIMEAG